MTWPPLGGATEVFTMHVTLQYLECQKKTLSKHINRQGTLFLISSGKSKTTGNLQVTRCTNVVSRSPAFICNRTQICPTTGSLLRLFCLPSMDKEKDVLFQVTVLWSFKKQDPWSRIKAWVRQTTTKRVADTGSKRNPGHFQRITKSAFDTFF